MNTWQLNKGEGRLLSKLNSAGLDCCLIYLTPTGMKKGILDATAPLRELLYKEGLHNFSSQKQGPENKVILKCTYFLDGNAIPLKISCYRPLTKKGDPRLWPYSLNKIASENHVLALFVVKGDIYIINLSQDSMLGLDLSNSHQIIQESPASYNSEFTQFIDSLTLDYNQASNELLHKLRQLAMNGPLSAFGTGDTAIGRTIETHLGIDINSSPLPDYKGIEIKSSRSSSKVRSNLFAKVADWDISKLKSSREILEAFGYERDDGKTKKLYCSISTQKPNSQGLIFDLDLESERLNEYIQREKVKGSVCAWRSSSLHDKLYEKHKETFWITADEVENNSERFFKLTSVKHTRRPSSLQFDRLLGCGEITMDHLIKLNLSTGKCTEKGPLFKIAESSVDELFLGQPQVYGLTQSTC